MLKLSKFFLASALFCFLASGVVFSENTTTIEAKASKTKIATGEVFVYSVKLDGDFASPKLNLPDFKNFVIVSRQETRNYTTKDNKLRLTLQLNFGLIAPKPGTFTIDNLSVEEKGQKISANSLTIEVTGAPIEENQKNKANPYSNNGVDI